ncbi:urease accessory protein UreD [Aspergillus californicus]
MSYGGGLVAGDTNNLKITVQQKARLAFLTQGSTKVYKTPSMSIDSRQKMDVTVEEGTGLVLLPDPIQPFRDSAYEQRQLFHINHASSSILILDWVSADRAAGEEWQLFKYKGRNDIWSLADPDKRKKRLLIRDSIALSDTTLMKQDYRHRMDGLGVFGTIIMRGPILRALGDFLKNFLPSYGSA